MSKKGGMKRTNVWLTVKQLERLAALAEQTGLKVAEHIRRAIDSYLDTVAPQKEGGVDDGKGE